ncbi:MAG: hypothetical protein KDB62_06165 [Solirubrobacterales bacterium]|nr:hypothetical protein [Solirubrobacterales bacterium]
MTEINDANQMRVPLFAQLLEKPKTWILIVLLGVVGAAAGLFVGPLFALLGLIVFLLIGVGITFWIADHRAEQAFYDAYAESRGLTRQGKGELAGLTPLLRKGDKQRCDEIFTGPLADGIDGTLALFVYTVASTDSDGNRTETDYPFTVILTDLPETNDHLPELLVQRQSGLKALEKFEDKFRGKHERVTLESEEMRDRYEIFVGKGQDPIWVRRLFSPTFIVWLTEAPKKFAFELVGGHLCAFVPKHRDSAEGLDEVMSAGCEVADRLREEAATTS